MNRGGIGLSRDNRVRQIEDSEESVFDFATYIPIGQSQQKVRSWHTQGAEIVYLSSHTSVEDVQLDQAVLNAHRFPESEIYFRKPHQNYSDVVEKVMPDILSRTIARALVAKLR